VVWQLDGASADPSYRAIVRFATAFDASSCIAVSRDPGPIAADFPRLDVVGTAPGTRRSNPATLVQVNVGDRTPAIRDREVLLADCSRIDGWRSLGEREAVLFWIVTTPR